MTPIMSVGRNEPCPCGSGKKYKRCCLAAEEQASRPPGQELHELDHRLFLDIGHWAGRRFRAVMETCLDDYPIDIEEREEHGPLFAAWMFYECKVEGRALASWYLEERGRNLMAHERAWLTAQLESWLSVWEVLEVDLGNSIRLRDLLTGAERTVSEARGSTDLSPHLLLLARVVDHAGLSVLVGSHPAPLTPDIGKQTVGRIRSELELGKQVTPEELREGERPTVIIEIWEDAVEALQNRPLPRLQNTDGEDLVLVKDHYKLLGSGARAAVAAGLADLRDVEPPGADERHPCYRVTRENAKGSAMESTLIATVTLKARSMVVETNSRQRADTLRGRLEDSFGACLRFDRRDEQDAMDAMAKQKARPRQPERTLEGPEADALLLDFKKRHYATWADDSLPALDGLTPREVAAQPKYRARLDTLLKEMEYHESQEPADRRFDFGPIRRELGLG
jgi:hypothetical protein